MKAAIFIMAWALPILGFVVGASGGLSLRRFMTGIPSLETPEHLEIFKRVVAKNMYASLLVIILIAIAVVGLALGLYQQLISWKVVGVWVGFFGPLYAGGGAMATAIEQRARCISVSDPVLKQQYDDVVRVWRSKALPTW